MAWFGTTKNPKGPRMNRVIKRTLNLSGTKIQFDVPPNNDHQLPFESRPETYNLYSENIYFITDEAKVPVCGFCAYADHWVFYGMPLFQGSIGSMSMHISVQSMPEFANLFIPRRQEKAIERMIYAKFGPGANGFDTDCRMDWKVIHLNDTQWVNYRNNGIHPEWFWQTPLTERHLLTISFRSFNRLQKLEFEQAMLRFCQTIMASFQIQLSADALNQQAEAREKYPNQTLAEFLPPLEWAEKRVEDEDQVFFQLIEANPRKNERIFLPDGTIDRESEAKERVKVEREAKRIVTQQEKDLKETMAKTLASHLDFDD